jgi:hypothetical protein
VATRPTGAECRGADEGQAVEVPGHEQRQAEGHRVAERRTSDPAGTALLAHTTGHAYAFTAAGKVTDLGTVSFDEAQKGSVTLPATIEAGRKIKIAVVFDDTPLMWDAVTVRAAATER